MKRENTALYWALTLLALIIASIAFFYFRASSEQPTTRAPVFVDIGEVRGHAGDKRLVIANVVLEVANRKVEEKIGERKSRAKAAVTRSFSDFPAAQLLTPEGKLALQERIRADLNKLFDTRGIREVLFTSFLVGLS